MNTSNNDLLALELLLSNTPKGQTKFPEPNVDYFARYTNIKNHLNDHYFKYIGAGTSSKNGYFFTDHSQDHFNYVIRYAGKLIGLSDADDTNNFNRLNIYEVYMLLIAILLHDAGNAEGREEHEKKPFVILKEMGALAGIDDFEKRNIADIAEVHGGVTQSGSKDTIGAKKKPDNDEYHGIKFRPNLLAAILRFADEICEDGTRTSKALLDKGVISSDSEIHHRYAESIKNVQVDTQDKSICLKHVIQVSILKNKFPYNNKNIYLTDYILERLDKMNCERIYCSRFMYEIVQLKKIKTALIILDDEHNEVFNQALVLEDEGYPSSPIVLKNKYSNCKGKTLAQKKWSKK